MDFDVYICIYVNSNDTRYLSKENKLEAGFFIDVTVYIHTFRVLTLDRLYKVLTCCICVNIKIRGKSFKQKIYEKWL